MAGKGFGQPQPTKIDKIIERIVRYCQKRSPEALDKIFDSLPVGLTVEEYRHLNQQVTDGAVAALSGDIDALAWFCGYIASEINCSEDNHQPHHPITELAKFLIQVGMQPFEDFMPYPGCRLVIINNDKLQALSEPIKAKLQMAFNMMQNSPQQFLQMNETLLEEMVVIEE